MFYIDEGLRRPRHALWSQLTLLRISFPKWGMGDDPASRPKVRVMGVGTGSLHHHWWIFACLGLSFVPDLYSDAFVVDVGKVVAASANSLAVNQMRIVLFIGLS